MALGGGFSLRFPWIHEKHFQQQKKNTYISKYININKYIYIVTVKCHQQAQTVFFCCRFLLTWFICQENPVLEKSRCFFCYPRATKGAYRFLQVLWSLTKNIAHAHDGPRQTVLGVKKDSGGKTIWVVGSFHMFKLKINVENHMVSTSREAVSNQKKFLLVGGFNPSEKYESNWESSISRGETKNLSCHHPVFKGVCLHHQLRLNPEV